MRTRIPVIALCAFFAMFALMGFPFTWFSFFLCAVGSVFIALLLHEMDERDDALFERQLVRGPDGRIHEVFVNKEFLREQHVARRKR